MAETKIIVWLAYTLGVPFYIYALYVNIATWKSDILFVSALIMLGINGYYKIRKNEYSLRKEEQEATIRQIEIDNLKNKK